MYKLVLLEVLRMLLPGAENIRLNNSSRRFTLRYASSEIHLILTISRSFLVECRADKDPHLMEHMSSDSKKYLAATVLNDGKVVGWMSRRQQNEVTDQELC